MCFHRVFWGFKITRISMSKSILQHTPNFGLSSMIYSRTKMENFATSSIWKKILSLGWIDAEFTIFWLFPMKISSNYISSRFSLAKISLTFKLLPFIYSLFHMVSVTSSLLSSSLQKNINSSAKYSANILLSC